MLGFYRHGKPSRSTKRFRSVRATADGGSPAAATGGASVRGSRAGEGESSLGGPLGESVRGARAEGSTEGRTGRAQAALEWGGLEAVGAGPVGRARSPGLRNAAVDQRAGGGPDRAGVWGALPFRPRLADSGPVGLELPATG